MLEKPKEYKEVEAKQNNATIYAEDINQIIANIELIKGGLSNEAPVGNIKDICERLNKLADTPPPLSADLISFNNSKANLDFSENEKEINIQNAIETLNTKLENKITENTNNKVGFTIVDGQPYDTGITLNGKKIMKVMWEDIKNNAVAIKDKLAELEMRNQLLDTRVLGYANDMNIDITTRYTTFPCPYIVNNRGWYIIVLDIGIDAVSQEIVDFGNCDKEYIKGIEVTYLE